MTIYIRDLPTSEDTINRSFAYEIKNIKEELLQFLSDRDTGCASYALSPTDKADFLELISLLEKIFFINNYDNDTNNYVTYTTNKYDSDLFKTFMNSTLYKTGMVLKIAPKTHYEEIENVTHLEVVEKTLKTSPNQFLKIFTKNNMLGIFTNKQPTWNQLIEFKILQWTIFKDKIIAQEPNILRFLNGMLKENLNEINTALTNIMTRSDLIELKYKEVVKVLQYSSQAHVHDLQNAIENLQTEITEYENLLSTRLTTLRNTNIALAAAQNAPQEDMQLIVKYLMKHPYIDSFSADANRAKLSFTFISPLIYYDKYILEKIIGKKTGINKAILKIFETDKYELITRCKIIFNTKNFNVSFARLGPENCGIIGHPHIDTYSCFGNHNKAIQDAAKEGNYLGAIEQLSQATLNINFSDSYVIDSLLNLLRNDLDYYRTWKCKETGVMLTTAEVIANEEITID